MPPKVISGGDNPYDIHDAKLSRSATTHESSSVTAHEISNTRGHGRADAVVRKPPGSMQVKRKMSGGKSAHSFYSAPGIYHLPCFHFHIRFP